MQVLSCDCSINEVVDVDKIVGTLLLKEEKATMVTEIIWNWQK